MRVILIGYGLSAVLFMFIFLRAFWLVSKLEGRIVVGVEKAELFRNLTWILVCGALLVMTSGALVWYTGTT